MIILTLRTDKPKAEVALFENEKKLAYETWQAHRELSDTIHLKIRKISAAADKSLKELGGIVVYKGPGSFTGLRIGFSVANALAYGLNIPIVVTSSEDWVEQGIKKLLAGNNDKIALPEYGALPNITKPRK